MDTTEKVLVLGTLEGLKNYKIFNGRREVRNYFMVVKSPPLLLHVFAIEVHGNEEPHTSHILLSHCKNQTRHYYLIEAEWR